jgi:hypothetical protein
MIASQRVNSIRVFASVACAALLLAGCQKSLEDIVAANRPAVEAVFAKIQALEGAARDTPPVAEDKFDLGGARVVLDGEKTNALFIRQDNLADPLHATSDGTGSTRAGDVKVCGEALRGEFIGHPGGAELFLQGCARAEYLFVQRTRTDQAAELVGESSFEPGSYEGDVLLFRLDDGALLGGFAVAATSSDEVQVALDESGAAVDAIGRLNSDMTSRVFSGIDAKLRQHAPGSIRD